jgi:hypothetical protein
MTKILSFSPDYNVNIFVCHPFLNILVQNNGILGSSTIVSEMSLGAQEFNFQKLLVLLFLSYYENGMQVLTAVNKYYKVL